MPNHFHIVLRQGTPPLSYMMHRVMHRSALLLKRTYKLQGHVFERRYWSGVCPTPQYVRRAIVYTHLNPWRKQLCNDLAEYEWSTHSLYIMSSDERATTNGVVVVDDALRLFRRAADHDDSLQQYLEHVRFQMAVERFLRGEIPSTRILAPAECTSGDEHWFSEYSSSVSLRRGRQNIRSIYDVATRLLERFDPDCPMDLIRTNFRNPKIVVLRRNMVLALLTHDFRRVDIARFMGISPSTVSMIGAIMRC